MGSKNRLADFELEVARDFERRRKRKRRAPPELGKTRIAKGVRNRERTPPPVPKNKSIAEIAAMDPHDKAFRHSDGRPRIYINIDGTDKIPEEELSWRDAIRRYRQAKTNDRRASVRKYEAKVVAAVRVMEKQLTAGEKGMDLYDEDKLIAESILDLDDWDDEELIRGYRRNRGGRFGAPPKYIPREVQQAAFRRLVNRGERRMKESYIKAIDGLTDLAHHADSEKVRLEAIKELMNRVVGKVPDRVAVAVEQPWEGILADAMVPVSEVVPIELTPDDEGVYSAEPLVDDSGGEGRGSRSGGDETASSPPPPTPTPPLDTPIAKPKRRKKKDVA